MIAFDVISAFARTKENMCDNSAQRCDFRFEEEVEEDNPFKVDKSDHGNTKCELSFDEDDFFDMLGVVTSLKRNEIAAKNEDLFEGCHDVDCENMTDNEAVPDANPVEFDKIRNFKPIARSKSNKGIYIVVQSNPLEINF